MYSHSDVKKTKIQIQIVTKYPANCNSFYVIPRNQKRVDNKMMRESLKIIYNQQKIERANYF